jgi:hypothetical protein
MSKPVRIPLVTSWKNTTIAYAVQYVRRRISQVRSTTVSTSSAPATPISASWV